VFTPKNNCLWGVGYKTDARDGPFVAIYLRMHVNIPHVRVQVTFCGRIRLKMRLS